MSWCKRFHQRRQEDERGAVLILVCISMVALLAAGAMGVDLGFSVVGSRTAQAMADTAALDLAKDVFPADLTSNPQTSLNQDLGGVLTDNGSDADMWVIPGLYQNGEWTVPTYGCHYTLPPAVPPCNAVMVAARQTVPQPFWGGFNALTGRNGGNVGTNCGVSPNPPGVCTPPTTPSCLTSGGCTKCPAPYNSCVTALPATSFSIGSYLASLDTQQSGVLNSILSGWTGAGAPSLDITAVGYEGLATTNVTLNQLITASGGLLSPTTVMSAALTPGEWASILKDAVENQTASLNCGQSPTPEQCNSQTALSDLSWGGGSSLKLCQLFSITDENGTYNCTNATIDYGALSTSLDVLQMLTTAAELTNGSSAINVSSALSLPVTSSSLTLDVIQPAVVAYGPAGTSATTAQVSADLSLVLPLGLGTLSIPMSAADGTATLSTLTCNSSNTMYTTRIQANTTTATASVTLGGSAVATLTIAGASNAYSSYTASVVPPTATTASASPPTNPTQLGTTDPTPSITSTTGLDAGLVSTLLGSTLLPGTVSSILSPVLQAAGLSLGGANIADLGYITPTGVQEAANCTSVVIQG
jgi:uncharacterized membrane protein